MMRTDLQGLVVSSVTDPASVARFLIDLHLSRETLWTGLALVAVLNTMLFGLSNMAVPAPAPVPGMFNAPIVFLVFVIAGLLSTIYAITWTGRWMGGDGNVEDVTVVVLWMQILRVLVQAVSLVLLVLAPILSILLAFAAGLLGIYITLHFVNEAHRLASLGKAAGVLIASALAIVLALSLVISLFGGAAMEASSHV